MQTFTALKPFLDIMRYREISLKKVTLHINHYFALLAFKIEFKAFVSKTKLFRHGALRSPGTVLDYFFDRYPLYNLIGYL